MIEVKDLDSNEIAPEWEGERVKDCSDSPAFKKWAEKDKAQKERERMPYKACTMELE